MELKLKDKSENVITFIVEGSNPAYMNALRRISMNQIPTLAVEYIDIVENSSALFDEIFGQRMGQLPLKFDPEDYLMRKDCDCDDGCPNCEVKFSLKKEGPGMVYASDIEFPTSDVEVLYGKTPITYLGEKQEVELDGVASLNTGKDHSKHQAALTSYQYYPEIEIDQSGIEDVEKIVEICPTDVFEEKDGELSVKDIENCTLCQECVNETDGAIEVSGNNTKFILKVESISGLDPEVILEQTMDKLKEKADKVIEKLN